ncbi:MAG: T9SS type A sorting domain-containing protein [candidate division WOR-3 bacterium]
MKGSTVVLCLILAVGLAPGALPGNREAGHQTTTPLLSAANVKLAPNEVVLNPVVPVELEPYDNPDETLHYDRTPFNAIGLTNGGTFRGAVRFTPTYNCTLKAIIFYQRDASSDQYAFVFGEDTDTTPGAILDSMPYTGSGTLQWKRVNLTTPKVMKAGIDFWACIRITHTAGTFPLGVDSGPMIPNRSGFISTGGSWQQLYYVNPQLNYSWNIRAIVARGVTLAHDVGATKILSPGQSINPGSYPCKARIVNFGMSAESNIPVTCWIDSAGTRVYNQTLTYAGPLNPGNRADVTFTPNWNTGPSGASYSVRMFTSLAGDLDPSNDTVRQTTGIMTGQPLMTHDTGYCKLSVTCFGSIGYDNPPAQDLGVGFCYPKTATSALFYSSFAVGNDVNYVADRHFSNPANGPVNDDLKPVDSLRNAVPPTSDQHYRGVYSDAGHPAPKGIQVVQNSHQMGTAGSPGYDDFVVIAFDIRNAGASAVNGVCAGVFADFDIGTAPTANIAGSDTVRRLVYMRQQSTANPTVGVKILAPTSFKNLSCIDHARYVYPDSAMTDGMKWRFMNGTVVQRTSNRAYDWSLIASVGPFDLGVGQSYRFAVAFVGGTDETQIRVNADSAQSWYDAHVGIGQNPGWSEAEHRFELVPNPFRRSTLVHYSTPSAGKLQLSVYDAGGRLVEERTMDVKAGAGSFRWQPGSLARGVYFLDIKTPDSASRVKALLLE